MSVADAEEAQRLENLDRETDPHRVSQRQRQIDFGKNTIGYQRYLEQYPNKSKRPRNLPRTPDVHKKCSKRAFDGQVRSWRRKLHEWDLPEREDGAAASGRVDTSPTDHAGSKNGDARVRMELVGSEQKSKKATLSHVMKRDRTTKFDSSLSSPAPMPDLKLGRWADWEDVDQDRKDNFREWRDVCKKMEPGDVPEDILVSYSDDEADELAGGLENGYILV